MGVGRGINRDIRYSDREMDIKFYYCLNVCSFFYILNFFIALPIPITTRFWKTLLKRAVISCPKILFHLGEFAPFFFVFRLFVICICLLFVAAFFISIFFLKLWFDILISGFCCWIFFCFIFCALKMFSLWFLCFFMLLF